MNCPNCGAPVADGMKFCTKCGTPMAQQAAPVNPPVAAPVAQPVAAPVAQPAPAPAAAPVAAPVAQPAPAPAAKEPKKAGEKITFASVLASVKGMVMPVVDKIKPFLKNKFVLAGAAAAVLLLVVLCVLSIAKGKDNGYIQYKNNINIVETGEELVVVVNDKALKTTIEATDYCYLDSSLDGKIAVFGAYEADEDGDREGGYDLYVVKGKKVTKIAEDVSSHELAVSGKAVAYAQVEDEEEYTFTLSLQKVGSKKSTEITDEMSSLNFAISPDGKSVAYYQDGGDEDPDELYYAKGKKSKKITSKNTNLIGLSNNGKFIYATSAEESDDDEYLDYTSETTLYKYNTKGDRVKLGKTSSSNFTLNADHTQIMFYNDGKTYISTKGKDAEKAGSGMMYLLSAPNSSYADDTAPVDNFYDHVYASVNYNDYSTNIWLIKKNDNKSVRLVSKVNYAVLDESAEYLYFTRGEDNDLSVLKISHKSKAYDKAKELARDVDDFVVTSDRKFVYYVSDESLYRVNGKKGGTAKTITNDEVDSDLALNSKDVLFYVVDDELYACTNGRTGKRIASETYIDEISANGIVYFESEDAYLANKSGKKLKEVASID